MNENVSRKEEERKEDRKKKGREMGRKEGKKKRIVLKSRTWQCCKLIP